MSSSKLGGVIAFLLCASMILSLLPMSTAADVPETKTFLEESVEDVNGWTATWARNDANSGSSEDLWGPTLQKAHGGERSVYCARSGYNSHYFNSTDVQPLTFNLLGAGDDVSQTTYVQRYDTNQDTIMRKYVSGLTYYNNITLSFWFYSDTGASDAKQPDTQASVGYDFLNVVYYTGSNASLVKHVAWTDSQEQATSKAWNQVTFDIPNNATWVGFEFVSGSTVPEGGDAADAFTSSGVRTNPTGSTGMKEGVYIDDVSVVGTVPVLSVPLTTAADTIAPYQNNRSFPVNWVDNDPLGITMDWAYLYYRINETGTWIRYTNEAKPLGAFVTSPIQFNATSDGKYEFFTQGKAFNGTMEVKRNAADVFTFIDTVAPTSTITVTGPEEGGTYVGSATFTLVSTDSGSGVNKTSYRVDSGEWINYSSSVTLTTTGHHVVEYFATDNASNNEVARGAFVNITGGTMVESGITFDGVKSNYGSGENVTIAFNVVSANALSKLEYSLDGADFVEIETNATAVTLSGLSDGEHKLLVRATDVMNGTLEKETTFTVGGSGSSFLSDPLVIGVIGVVAAAAIGGAVLYVWRKKP